MVFLLFRFKMRGREGGQDRNLLHLYTAVNIEHIAP